MSYLLVYPALVGAFMLQSSVWSMPLSLLVMVMLAKSFMLSGESGFSMHYQSFLCDSISVIFCVLSVMVVILSAAATKGRRSESVVVNFFLSLVGLVFLFTTNNLFTYLLLFELSLVPLYFLIAFWSAQYERVLSNYYFVLFSVVTSAPLLLVICELLSESSLEYISTVAQMPSSYQLVGKMVMASILLAFMAKLPVYSLHSWLPKAHVDAPVGGSMVLASMLLKLSGYSVLRLFFSYTSSVSLVLVFSVWGYMVTAAMCMRLVDYKVVVAYSSVSHMSIAFSGLVSFYYWSVTSAFVMMVGHGVVSPLMFYLSNLWYERVSTRSISAMKSSKMWFSASFTFLLAFLFNISFPPFMNFFAEVSLFFSVVSSYSVSGVPSFLSFCFSSVCWLNIIVMMFHSKKKEKVQSVLTPLETSLSVGLVTFFLAFSLSLSII